MADFFRAARIEDPSIFPVIITQSNPELIAGYLRTVGFSESDYLIRRVDPDELPDYLMACDAAISFIKPCYSKLSSSPTKIAEYLAAGLPIISNSGIGDLDEQLTQDRVGVVIEKLDQEEYKKALVEIKQMTNETDLVERCQRTAKKRFDLATVGGPAYIRLYSRLKTGE
ncbi:MAG: hypothetical protein IPJ07_10695 [Acidobacteria bacterium]|nr:hypothetical protein [Acidobacteriota bacterium]